MSKTPTKPIDYAALSAGYGALTGALQLVVSTSSAGPVGSAHVSITGPTYVATYTSSGSEFGVGYTCTITGTMAPACVR